MSRMPDVGDVVDDVFRVEDELDHGNFGAIYRVHDILEDRTLALKIQKPGPHDEDEVRQRFEREARLIYSLDHKNIVEVLYFGQTSEGLPYMAMEFLVGTDLKQLLRGGYAFNPEQIKRIALETLSALRAAHDVGIVHRDLKPANIFLVDDGEQGYVKVLDFGFAKALDGNSREITRANTLVGSPAYMAPELVHKENVGTHSDLYAMGLIIAEMITGEKTIQIESIYDTIMFQGSDNPIELAPAVENSLFAGIIRRAVRKDIDRRYTSAEEMIQDVNAVDLGAESADLQEHAEVEDDEAVPFVLGDADPDAETEPRSHGMPSVEKIDQTLEEDFDAGDPAPAGRESGRQPPVESARANSANPQRASGRMEAVDRGGEDDNNDNSRRTESGLQKPVGRNFDGGRPDTGAQQAVQSSGRADTTGQQSAPDIEDTNPTGPQSAPDIEDTNPTGPQSAPEIGEPNPTGPRSAPDIEDTNPNAPNMASGATARRTDNPGKRETISPEEGAEIDLESERPAHLDRRRDERSLVTEILLGILLGAIALAVILAVIVFAG